MRPDLVFAFPLPSDNVGISYTALSFYHAMRTEGYGVSFVTPLRKRGAGRRGITETSPLLLKPLPWKLQSQTALGFYRQELLKRAKPRSVIYFWADQPTSLYREVKARGAIVCKEKFNCAQRVSRRILQAESARNGVKASSKITDRSIETEEEQFGLADYIFSPSPMVAASLRECGVAESKIIPSSFGWSPKLDPLQPALPQASLPRPWFLFVGTFCVRKGAHLLLDYWRTAGVEGTLLVMGKVHADMARAVTPERLPPNVALLGHQEKAHEIFRQSDVFIFPSLEEGGPLVTYEALSRGLPCLVSPMGAGAAVRHDKEGFVVPPHEAESWVSAIKKMAADPKLRETFAAAARERAPEFTWTEVAKQRYARLVSKLKTDFPEQAWEI